LSRVNDTLSIACSRGASNFGHVTTLVMSCRGTTGSMSSIVATTSCVLSVEGLVKTLLILGFWESIAIRAKPRSRQRRTQKRSLEGQVVSIGRTISPHQTRTNDSHTVDTGGRSSLTRMELTFRKRSATQLPSSQNDSPSLT
jgi:hypothetical protein